MNALTSVFTLSLGACSAISNIANHDPNNELEFTSPHTSFMQEQTSEAYPNQITLDQLESTQIKTQKEFFNLFKDYEKRLSALEKICQQALKAQPAATENAKKQPTLDCGLFASWFTNAFHVSGMSKKRKRNTLDSATRPLLATPTPEVWNEIIRLMRLQILKAKLNANDFSDSDKSDVLNKNGMAKFGFPAGSGNANIAANQADIEAQLLKILAALARQEIRRKRGMLIGFAVWWICTMVGVIITDGETLEELEWKPVGIASGVGVLLGALPIVKFWSISATEVKQDHPVSDALQDNYLWFGFPFSIAPILGALIFSQLAIVAGFWIAGTVIGLLFFWNVKKQVKEQEQHWSLEE